MCMKECKKPYNGSTCPMVKVSNLKMCKYHVSKCSVSLNWSVILYAKVVESATVYQR